MCCLWLRLRVLLAFRLSIQTAAAVFAKPGIVLVSGAVAVGAFLVPSAFIVFHHGGRNDSCRYGDDRIADKHHAGGKELSESGDRGDVTIAYGGHGDDCPVDTVRDVVELGIGLRALYHVHQRSDRSHQNDDEQEKRRLSSCCFRAGR